MELLRSFHTKLRRDYFLHQSAEQPRQLALQPRGNDARQRVVTAHPNLALATLYQQQDDPA